MPPGVVGCWGSGSAELAVQGLAVGYFSLTQGLLVDDVGEGFVVVEEGDFSFGSLKDGDLGVAQGIDESLGLDLVKTLLA